MCVEQDPQSQAFPVDPSPGFSAPVLVD
jgi:hypothetical protein